MNFKRISTLALAFAMTASLTPASAEPETVDVPVSDRYHAAVSVNGQSLESVTFVNVDPETYAETEVTMTMDDLPGAPAGYVPMRMLCAADPNGFADWIVSENSATFFFHKTSFIVYFDDLSVELDGEKVPGVKAYLNHDGVTFIPVSFLATLPNVELDDHPEMDSERYDFKLVVAPIAALADSIKAETGCGASFELSAADLEQIYNVPAGAIEDVAAYAPMMTSPDSIFIVKVADGQKGAVQEAFEAYRQQQIDTFTWYLPDNLPKAENGQIVTQGSYMMLYIGESADKAVELFKTGAAELEQ